MTTIITPSDPPMPATAPALVAPPAPPRLSGDQQFIRSENLWKESDLKPYKLQARELQDHFLQLYQRARDPGRMPEAVYNEMLRANPSSRTTPDQIQHKFEAEQKPIHDQMNADANRAVQIAARLAKETVERLNAKIEARVSHEKNGWNELVPFAESPYVKRLRSPIPPLSKVAEGAKTIEDEGGQPAKYVVWWFDL